MGDRLGHPDVARDLTDDVCDIEERNASRPFDIRHVQVFWYTCEAGIAGVNATRVAKDTVLL
jgi:hypothetical protein